VWKGTIYLFLHLFICVYIVRTTSPSSPLPPQPLFTYRNLFCVLALQFCWRENIIRKTAFLLVWDKDKLYREIPIIASIKMCIATHIGWSLPDLFTTSWFSSHSGLCQFKITVFAPLQWAHQPHSSFSFLPFPYSFCVHSPLSVWPMSNNITAFVLGLKSTYEGEHRIFRLLSLANFV
jgi:hypothetical protein